MQPIHYSLILNLVTFIGCAILAYLFSQPWIIVIVLMLQSHALERFREIETKNDNDLDEQPMGFMADVK